VDSNSSAFFVVKALNIQRTPSTLLKLY